MSLFSRSSSCRPDVSNVAPEDPVSYPQSGDPSSDSDSSVGNSSLEARSRPGSPLCFPRGRDLLTSRLQTILDERPLSPIRTFPRRRRQYNRISRFEVISRSSSSSSDLSSVSSSDSSSRSPSPLGPRLPPSPRSSSPPMPVLKKPRFVSPAPSDSEDEETGTGTVYVLPTPKRRSPRRRVILQPGKSSDKRDEMFVLFGPPMTSSDSDLDDEPPTSNNKN